MEKVTCTHCGANNKPINKYCTNCGFELPKITPEVTVIPAQQPATNSGEKRKRIMSFMAFATFFCISFFTVQYVFFKPPSINKIMMQVASELNKTSPVMVDQFTRFDNAAAMPDNSFMYNYTLVNLEKSQVNLDTVKKYMFPPLINNIKTSPDLKYFRENKITMIYNYRDKNGVFVLKYTVTPEMYE